MNHDPKLVKVLGVERLRYLDGVPIYRITQKHNWNLLLCDLRAYSGITAYPFQKNGAPFRLKLSKAQLVN